MVVPIGHVGHLDADHQAEREQRVHQRLAPFGLLLAEMPVDVQRLRVERHVGEQHVVHLRHRAVVAMLGERADDEALEIEPAALVAVAPCPWCCCRPSCVLHCAAILSFHLPQSLTVRFHPGRRRIRRASRHTAGGSKASHERRAHRHYARRDRRDPPGGAGDRRRLQVSAGHRPGRIQLQSQCRRRPTSSARGLFQFIEQTWLATLKEQGAGAGLRALCRRDRAAAVRAILGDRSADVRPHHGTALRPERQRADGRRLHPRERRQARRAARPRPDRGRALHRALPGAERREPADRAWRDRQPNTPAAADFPGARARQSARSSTTRAAMRAAPARSIARWSAATASRAAGRRTRRWPASCRLLRTPRTPASSAWSA